MKSAKGIPCNETRHTLKAEKDRICFRFVTEDGNTPSACTVSIGDTDPMTGETITDMTFFTEYHRMADHDIYSWWKSRRPALTAQEKRQRGDRKTALAEDFEAEYGYRPRESDLQWMTDGFRTERTTVSVEQFRDEEGCPEIDRIGGVSIPFEDPFAENEPDEIFRLRALASTLKGEMADLYEWLLVKYAGGKVKLSMQEIADRWGISLSQAYKDKDRLVRMIREACRKERKAQK